MEFSKKLQQLRKQNGLTQEELARELYVSRTAVSKWESGRGYPNIDSLKAIADFFSVTVDDLLSGNEILTIAEKDNKKKENTFLALVFGLLDISVALFFFLPLFGQNVNGKVREVSLLSLTEVENYLKILYFTAVIVIVAFGVLMLALQNCGKQFCVKTRFTVSLALNAAGALLFIISTQAYAATVLFVFAFIKAVMLIKKR